MKIQTRELTPELWPSLEELFGPNGGCGGCWCQSWKVRKGERLKDIEGREAKRRFRAGIKAGTTLGILAFVKGQPVGWCNFGPRLSFPRLERCRTLKCDDAECVWSIPCFYVARRFREKGVASALLTHAVRAIKRRGGKVAEAYPTKPGPDGRYIPTFAWTGTRSMFAKAGFKVAGNRYGGKQRVRKDL